MNPFNLYKFGKIVDYHNNLFNTCLSRHLCIILLLFYLLFLTMHIYIHIYIYIYIHIHIYIHIYTHIDRQIDRNIMHYIYIYIYMQNKKTHIHLNKQSLTQTSSWRVDNSYYILLVDFLNLLLQNFLCRPTNKLYIRNI